MKRKKAAAGKKRRKKESVESIFRSHAAKLGIPKNGSVFDEDSMRVSWTGDGEKCSEIISAVEKKALENSFERINMAHPSQAEDPVVEELIKMRLMPEARREWFLRKSAGGWTASVMAEHILGETPEHDEAIILFVIEETEDQEEEDV